MWNPEMNSENYNDWTTSSLMTTLNSGDYYNRTFQYEHDGLTSTAKKQISSTKWYLGNVVYNNNFGTTKEIYIQERSTNVHNGNKQTWDGKVALIYPSDYMYASSACYNDDTKKGYDSSGSSPYDTDYRSETCKSTNWLLDTNKWFWAVSPSSGSLYIAAGVGGSGGVSVYSTRDSSGGLCQSVYLDSSVKYIGGDGTAEKAYEIE